MSSRPRILCIDDRAENLKIRATFLELFGCEVVPAHDYKSALQALNGGNIDLLIIDYHLGDGATGEEIARDVRAFCPKLPLIMLSGDPNLPDTARESVDAVLTKGASNPRDLLDLIQKLLPNAAIQPRRPSPDFPPIQRAG